jgi:arabinan endo-1,5-alpha-L-arabinosidase
MYQDYKAIGRRWFLALAFLGLAAHPVFAGIPSGAIGSHDPSRIIDCDGVYYIYSTGGRMEYSTDLVQWNAGPSPFPAAPITGTAAMTGTGGAPGTFGFRRTMAPASVQRLFDPRQAQAIWAPDVIYRNQKYYMYYCEAAKSGTFTAIGLMTSPALNPNNPAYHWTDVGLVVSDYDKLEKRTSIDPCPFTDANGDLWLSYGSGFANGTSSTGPTINVIRLDNTTGLPSSTVTGRTVVAFGHIEASYVYYHRGYYYLFWNSGGCCAGARSSYIIHVARSRAVTGPYVDKKGEEQKSENFLGPTVVKNSIDGNEHGPGQIGILSEDGIDRCTYHYYPDKGRSVIGEETMLWGADGWPSAGTDLAPGVYKITSSMDGAALGVSTGGGAPDAKPYTGNANQQWKVAFTYTSGTNADGYYSITSAGTGAPLDLSQFKRPATVAMPQAQQASGAPGRWIIEETGDGNYRIVSPASREALTVPQTGGDSSLGLSVVKRDMGAADGGVLEWKFGAP